MRDGFKMQEYRHQRESHIVTPEQTREILKSSRFVDALTSAASETADSGHETRFSVYLDKDNVVLISDVVKGNSEAVGRSSGAEVILDSVDVGSINNRIGVDVGRLMTVHFHPNADGPIVPSEDDLINSFSSRDQFPISLIGIVRMDRRVELLLLKPGRTFDPNTLDGFGGRLPEAEVGFSAAAIISRQEEVKDVLNEFGVQSAILKFKPTDDGRYRLLGNQSNRLHGFDEIRVFFGEDQ